MSLHRVSHRCREHGEGRRALQNLVWGEGLESIYKESMWRGGFQEKGKYVNTGTVAYTLKNSTLLLIRDTVPVKVNVNYKLSCYFL